MSRDTLINETGEWLIDQALGKPDIVEMFDMLCKRLVAVGVPISRARLTWPTLHPLFQAETILWRRDSETEFEQFKHQDEVSEAWLASPMHFVLENGLDTLRRNLDGPNKIIDFPILEELEQQGHTDYILITSAFDGTEVRNTGMESGLLVTWSSDREGGFSDDDIRALKKIQRRFAVACKNVVQHRISSNITETYLGRKAGRKVLDGAIKLGDGEETKAVVWYSDMRNSTALADTMPAPQFLELLNAYFEATAGPVTDFGGEVLDFIGDAVLGIFPFDDEEGKKQAISCASLAAQQSLQLRDSINQGRLEEGKLPFQFGVGLNVGKLMFGNIGVRARLAFSVIGPTVNEVERMETMTKSLDFDVLVSEAVASAEPDLWEDLGEVSLAGVSHKTRIFGLSESMRRTAARKTLAVSDAVHPLESAKML